MKSFIVGLVAGACLALPVASQAGEASPDRDDWKPDYTCWYVDDLKINCRLDINTKDTLVRFRERAFIDGEPFGTFTVWPQRMEKQTK